jgi:hypothetical protein
MVKGITGEGVVWPQISEENEDGRVRTGKKALC